MDWIKFFIIEKDNDCGIKFNDMPKGVYCIKKFLKDCDILYHSYYQQDNKTGYELYEYSNDNLLMLCLYEDVDISEGYTCYNNLETCKRLISITIYADSQNYKLYQFFCNGQVCAMHTYINSVMHGLQWKMGNDTIVWHAIPYNHGEKQERKIIHAKHRMFMNMGCGGYGPIWLYLNDYKKGDGNTSYCIIPY